MASHPYLDDFVLSHPRFYKETKWLIMSQIKYKETAEKVRQGFRYFSCESAELVEAFHRQDFEAISALPFCLDDDDEPDTSAVCLDVWYTASGAAVLAQPVEYINHNPQPIAEPLLLEGDASRAILEMVRTLDQSL
ncbi:MULTISPECIES: hypothetical protein [Variovorax]|uniref:hypothetical protein n=1 Tax=Variovorax TaxID=34072 RepID=UPI00285DA56F|nr:hypothetical protein [Variovorax sp. 3319]MDR6890665.1 hypothetical protein [Variovorax sp. 3319]